ncbi:MAG: hypothetical protein M3281_04760 [Chloroflexota bacterium]|nr:hypothetical protein [Chloroflexota bacterium]
MYANTYTTEMLAKAHREEWLTQAERARLLRLAAQKPPKDSDCETNRLSPLRWARQLTVFL